MIALSPNASAADVGLAASYLARPWSWRTGPLPARVEQWFRAHLPAAEAVAFDSGRSGMYAILKALGVGEGDEVLLQAYTCVVVPNAVLWCGARPRYVDVAPTGFNMDVADLEKKIGERTKAVLVQHTFGHAVDIERILALARTHGLAVIEDCAHALGARYRGRALGTFGDAAFFSLGRDKVVSSVFGGVATTDDPDLAQALRRFQADLVYPPRWWIAQQLLHPIGLSVVTPTYYRFALGKILLVAMQQLRLLSLAVDPEERRGGRPAIRPSRFPNALAALALGQLEMLDKLNTHRRAISRVYDTVLDGAGLELPARDDGGAIDLRYTLQVPDPVRLRLAARRHDIMLGDWYNVPIAPGATDLGAIGYTPGECPRAEELARHSVNLPTHRHVTEPDAAFIANLVLEELR